MKIEISLQQTGYSVLQILLFLLFSSCQTTSVKSVDNSLSQADMVIRNGKVMTSQSPEKFASAVAIKDSKVVFVGNEEQIIRYISDSTQVIDAGGKTVIPGLNDSHLHVIRGGLNYNLELRWDGVASLEEGLNMIREQAKRTPKGQWIRVVGGWNEYQFKEKRLPTLQEINEAAPETPVFVLYLYAKALLNRAALKEVGYTSKTTFKDGVVELDESGTPTGMLIAKPDAMILYSTLGKGPVLSAEDQVNSTLQYMRELNRLGVTSAIDAGGGGQPFPENYQIASKLAKEGKLTLRIGYYLFAQKRGEEIGDYTKWAGMINPGQNDDFFRPNGYLMCGGGENLVWSAADFENFLEPRPHLGEHMEEELEEVVTLLVRNRWAFRIHGTYDESIDRFLTIFEKINKQTPFNGLRWCIDHAETVSDKNLLRIKSLGGGIAIQDRMAFQGESFINRYGADAARATPPVKKMMAMGIPVGLGTDGTRVSSYNPWLSLYWLVSGKTLGGKVIYPEESRLSRQEALGLLTRGSAWFSGEEDKKGTIAPGMMADIAILSGDYFSVPEEAIKNMVSVLTLVNGKVVYGAQEFAALSPAIPAVKPAWSPVAYFGGYQHVSRK